MPPTDEQSAIIASKAQRLRVLALAGTGKTSTLKWRLWDQMRDPANESVPIPHDGYLKLWSLNQPTLPYDIILLDEAQDTNAPVLEVLKAQSSRLVFVGDPMQAIYAWRGAVNAMAMPSDETLYLTGSFRFGPEIAEIGDAVLHWISHKAPTLRGLAEPGYVGRLLKGQQLAVLGRTNEGLFDMAASLVIKRPEARIGWIGGINAYGFDVIEQVFRLWSPDGRPDDPDIARFTSFDDLQDYAEHAGDRPLKIRAKVVEKYGERIPYILSTLRNADYGDRAPNVFSTVHRAKGGEWPQVVMAEDFRDMIEGEEPVDLVAEAQNSSNPEAVMEDARLRYVAVTRAKRSLRPDNNCMAYMHWLERQRSAEPAPAKSC